MTSTTLDGAAATVAPQAWYRQFWPWFLIALPGSTVLACMFTIWLAISNPEEVLRAPVETATALRPYGEVRSAYPELAAPEGTATDRPGAEQRSPAPVP